MAAIVGTHVFFLWRVRERIERGDPDFTVFYTAGKMLRQGLGPQLYHPHAQQAVQATFTRDLDIRRGPLPYIHPPFEALVFLPLTFLPYPTAFALWNLINLGLLFGVMLLLSRSLTSLQKFGAGHAVLLSLAFFPVFANFHQGQDAILLLLIVTLTFRALERDRDLLAGCWLGFGLFKYHLILPLALIVVVWRGKKFFAGFSVIGTALVLISVKLVGWKGALEYPKFAWQVVSEPAFGGIPPRQLLSLFGLLGGLGLDKSWQYVVQAAVAVTSVTLLVVTAKMRKLAAHDWSFRLCFTSAVITALLVGYSTNSYDLSLLVVPLAIVADYAFRNSASATRVFIPIIPLLVSPLWFFLWMQWQRIYLMAFFLLWWLWTILSEIRHLSAGHQNPSENREHVANV